MKPLQYKGNEQGSRCLFSWVGVLTLLFIGISCQSGQDGKGRQTLFRSLPPRETGIDFANQLRENEQFNIIQYLYYYNGGGVAAGDIDNDGLQDLYFTGNQTSNRLYRNKGGLQFEDITEKAGVSGDGGWSTGVTMADVNADGWLDLYVCQVGNYKVLKGRNRLYINNGDGTFTDRAAEYGLDFSGFSTQAAFFDYDRDGDLDCYLLNHSVHSASNYTDADIRGKRDNLAGDRLYRNDGGRFTDVSAAAGIFGSRVGYGLGIGIGDLNNDGWPDIYVSNDFFENDYLYYNNGDGTFRESVRNALGHSSTFSMGNDIADFNNDGWLDLITLDMKPGDETILKSSVGADPYNIYEYKLQFGYYYQYPRNMLQLNQGRLFGQDAQFAEIGQLAGVDATDWSWSPLFCDLDNDGWKDLFISNGIQRRPNDLDFLKFASNQEIQAKASDLELASKMPDGKVPNAAFRNKGDLSFEGKAASWGLDQTGCSNGAAYADLDNDGDLDLILNNLNAPASILENQSKTGNQHYLQLAFKGLGGNRQGIGARVRIKAGGLEQVQEWYPTRGFQSSVAPILHFGLGQAALVDTLVVNWPTGEQQVLTQVKADQRLTLDQQHAEKPAPPAFAQSPRPLFRHSTAESGIAFSHQENTFNDFDEERLLPHMLSTQGPRIAKGDVNGDGLDDVYICSAAGQSGALFLQTAGGRFTASSLRTDPAYEETDAAFFDADGDKDLDLYVVSGGGAQYSDDPELQDQLYLNDGRGRFQKGTDALPAEYANGSCVVPLDFNADGAMDLFVGSRSRPGFYGLVPRSYLLQNDGKGHFRDVTEQVAPELAQVGMVTDAALLIEDGRMQLVVVGEWMPVTIFNIPSSGKWPKTELPYSNGWWNAVEITDLDGDEKPDLLLGNLGLNADLRTSRKQPVELFVKDFDDNLRTDPILAYYRNGRRYPYFSKDEIVSQLPSFRKRYVEYAEFARSDFDVVFPPEQLKGAVHHAAYTFASCVAMNQGQGRFELMPLPSEAQFSPIMAFAVTDANADGKPDILAVGNFFEVRPGLGRYDATYGLTLIGNGKGAFSILPARQSGFIVPGQGRDISIAKDSKGRERVIIGRNKGSVVVFEGVR